MGKFNSTAANNRTKNKAGGDSFKTSPELELVSALLTSFLKDTFYENSNNHLNRIESLIDKVDPIFAAKASIYARNEIGMRSVSHVIAGQIAGKIKGKEWTKSYFDKIVYRPDDMMEILSYYKSKFGNNEPNALKKGFAKALLRFDEYQLAKYRSTNKSIKLVDIVNLVHPKHTNAIAKLVKDELRNKRTFESKLSEAGNNSESKSNAWSELINNNDIGYMALVKNLRNILESVDEETLEKALAILVDKNRIKKSKLLPFRFVTAYEQLSNVNDSRVVLESISDTLDTSFDNVPKFDGRTLVAIDHSGSMGNGVNSSFGKGAIFGIALAKSNNADLIHFGDLSEYLNFDSRDSTISIFNLLNSYNTGWSGSGKGYVGHGTNFNSIFETADKKYDRIIIISDMQSWGGFNSPNKSLASYKNRFNASPIVYSWDISGYGTLEFPENNIVTLAGWSEKIFDIMKLAETDKKALINKINNIEI